MLFPEHENQQSLVVIAGPGGGEFSEAGKERFEKALSRSHGIGKGLVKAFDGEETAFGVRGFGDSVGVVEKGVAGLKHDRLLEVLGGGLDAQRKAPPGPSSASTSPRTRRRRGRGCPARAWVRVRVAGS